jgi:hypothetical protein
MLANDDGHDAGGGTTVKTMARATTALNVQAN